MVEKDILHETAYHWVMAVKTGFEVYRLSPSDTHSVRCARIGFKGAEGLARAVAECEKRETALARGDKPTTNRIADKIDGYDRDNLGESPDY